MRGLCFVIQPYDKGKYDKRYRENIEPAVRRCQLDCYRVDEEPSVEIPFNQIEEKIKESVLCIAEITEDNPNVWFEVGYAYACGKKIILVCSDQRKGDYPFDVRHHKVLRYGTESRTDFERYEKDLEKAIAEYSGYKSGKQIEAVNGYYEATVLKTRPVRSKGKSCCCYLLDGLLDEVKDVTEGESHWLFCEKEQFEEIKAGDRVRFCVRSVATSCQSYPGAFNARNVYVRELKKV